MSDSRFQQFVGATRTPQLVKDEPPKDDDAEPQAYEAIRRIRTFHFADVVFRHDTGTAQAFPWHNLRTWMLDEAQGKLILIWPEAMVTLIGHNLRAIEQDILRRIIAEFRQVRPNEADGVPVGAPVIFDMRIEPVRAD